MGVVGRLDQYASMLAYEFDETTANNPSITGLGTYYASEFSENVGIATTMTANVFAPYDIVYDEFAGVLYGPGQGRYMRQNTDKSVIVYNEIDEITNFTSSNDISFWTSNPQTYTDTQTSGAAAVTTTSNILTSATLTATGFGSNVPIDFDFDSYGLSPCFIEIYKNNSLLFSYTNSPSDSSYNVSYNTGDTFYFKIQLSSNGVILPIVGNVGTHTLILKTSGQTIFTFNLTIILD